MGSAFLPIATALFVVGLTAQAWQTSQGAPGAGIAGAMDSRATTSAQQGQMWGAACLSTASGTPGLVSTSINPTLPLGVLSPQGAVCMTAARAGGGRDVYAYLPRVPGAIGALMRATQGDVTWYRVDTVGSATNLATGGTVAVPTFIPASSLLQWAQISS